jgi:glutathione S-transferase
MSRMSAWPAITLRYFTCRGRVQYLRYFLRTRGIPFTDERVPLSAGFVEWQALKGDGSRTGPFRKLPVLHWGEQLIAETPVIHAWLHEKTGDATRLSELERLRHAMLSSSCATDLNLHLGILLYSDLAHAGTDLATEAKNTLPRLTAHLQVLDRTLTEWNWHDTLQKRDPMLADCQLWDVLNFAETVFGTALSLKDLPALEAHYRECPGRKDFQALLDEYPGLAITARPGEAEAIARIRAAVGSN